MSSMNYGNKMTDNKIDIKDAMEITDQAEADAWRERYVQFVITDRPCERPMAEDIVGQNLGYFSGYYGLDVQRRVEKLFRTKHPIFGSVDGGRNLTPQKLIDVGVKVAQGTSIEDALIEIDDE